MYKKADGFIIVFDITNRASFEDIKNYFLPKIKQLENTDIPIFIIGHKIDKEEDRKVSMEESYDLAFENNCIYKETSCLKSYNLNEIFEDIFERTKIYVDNKENNDNNSFRLNNNNNLHNNRRGRCLSCC